MLLDQSLINLWKAELDKFWILKFKFSFGFEVCKAMEDMGVSLNVKLETVVLTIFHKACVEIDEVGTEAAAITVSMLAGDVIHEINSWAEKATKGFITNILEPGSLTPMTVLVLANALHFKETWSDKFDSNLTQNRDFCLLNGSTISTPYMTSQEDYQFGSFDGFKPFPNKLFLLPNKLDGLPDLLETINSDFVLLNRSLMNLEEVEHDKFRIPKFKFSYGFNVREALEDYVGISLNVNPR
ncbi:unnamed protein product [Camellia sinensis]